MKTFFLILFCFFSTLPLILCENFDDNLEPETDCDTFSVLNDAVFTSTTEKTIRITNASIEKDCLSITFKINACSGSGFSIELLASEQIQESDPPQRALKLNALSDTSCDSTISLTRTFDIRNLKTEGNRIVLTILNGNKSIIYNY